MKETNNDKKELSEIHKDRISHFKEIGLRLKELRNQEGVSREALDDLLEFSKRTNERIEAGEGGNVKSFVSLLLYYVSKGYNLNWILVEDNTNLFKKEQNLAINIDLGMAEELVLEIGQNAKELQKIFDKII